MSVPTIIREALDPRQSVVVEACAGSGKTWLLVSRILRLLLDGVAPGQILAITFTRKAAREIEERLARWLRELATGSEDEARDFLLERGVPAQEIGDAVARARRLYECVLTAAPPLTVSTFHGWYARLVQGAPLTSGLAGFVLHESDAGLMGEVWQLFADARGRRNDAATASLLWLLQHCGLEGARELMFGLARRRAEWHAFAGEGGKAPARALQRLRDCLGVGEAPAALATLLGDELFMRKLHEYEAILQSSDLEGDRQLAATLAKAFIDAGEEARFAAISAALLTGEGEPRQRKPAKALDKRFGSVRAARLVELHGRLYQRVLDTRDALREEQAHELNRHAFIAGAAWLEMLERHKQERQLMDFADLELQVARMLADEAGAAFLQARLDARYRHILLDEFQDTNPLQWRILLDWLAAYGVEDAARPRIFLVGDPKQSIYRFRRAEPRVFDCAAAFLGERFDAKLLAQDETRRNAPALVEVINRVFDGERLLPHFRRHRSLAPGRAGRVELLPLCGKEPAAAAAQGLRDPLAIAQTPLEDGRRRDEAAQLAGRIAEIVGRWSVEDEMDGKPRPARYGDIMVLARRRAALGEIERALRRAGIPCDSAGRGGLLRTLEAADLSALLRCLVATGDDLALAHALRTPALGASDDDLLLLARRPESGWWQRLQACAGGPETLAGAARLLAGWRAAAARLPVHDLLDRIYHEGDLLARYRDAVPAALWPEVAANLEAFLALALRLDAGRYPSLPRFLDELARLDSAGGEDAPDEGTIQAESGGDRVRLLTIHGAKGLEAPIVWLVDAHATHEPAEAWSLLVNWPPQSPGPVHFSVLGRKAELGARRAQWIEAEAEQAAREELNLLYVAMTRARQYFFASGIATERNGAKASFWQRLAAALEGLGGGSVHGEALLAAPAPAKGPAAAAAVAPAPDCPPVGHRLEGASPGMSYGKRLHAALDWLSAGGEAGRAPPGIALAEWPELRAAARAILEAPRLRGFFDPAAHVRALNEAEFALADGTVGRIDRLVELADGFWVLDYKSGRPDEVLLDAYGAQLEAYRSAVGRLYPGRPVRCALIFADGGFLEIPPAGLSPGSAMD
ncbi:MAG TPA: UvrD-helicase domain-containing protein [Candidatus Desulfobacillus sp.]|nr:UvrD-helicase domain-containing protein [Candidatus Desulfobacillus sp.]